eukprot:3265422-Pleurochrysis_carterae.AAC.1
MDCSSIACLRCGSSRRRSEGRSFTCVKMSNTVGVRIICNAQKVGVEVGAIGLCEREIQELS